MTVYFVVVVVDMFYAEYKNNHICTHPNVMRSIHWFARVDIKRNKTKHFLLLNAESNKKTVLNKLSVSI